MFWRRDSISSALILGPKIPGLSLRPLVFLNGEPGLDWMAPSTVTKLARTLDSGLVDPGVSEPTGDRPRDGGEVIGLWLLSNLASRLRTPGWALLSDMFSWSGDTTSSGQGHRSRIEGNSGDASTAQGARRWRWDGPGCSYQSHWRPLLG